MGTPPDAEARRQQRLLAALHQAPAEGLAGLAGWLRGPAPRALRGLQAYTANAGALAERALSAAFPTIAQLVGMPAMGALARAYWRAQPPVAGDMALWGGGLPGFIAESPQLAGEPYLADVARLDWAVHQAEQAADAAGPVAGLPLLADTDPAALRLRLAAGTAVVASCHPVASLWLAHRSSAEDRFDAVRQALADRAGEHALVWRDGWRAQVAAWPAPAGRFTQAVIDGLALEQAFEQAGPDFAFEPWLLAALQQGWLAAVEVAAGHPTDTGPTTSPNTSPTTGLCATGDTP